MSHAFALPPVMLAAPVVEKEDLPGGGFLLRSPQPLGAVTRCVGDWLEDWAQRTPNALFLAERDGQGEWLKLSYAQVRAQVRAMAQGLLDLGLAEGAPVVCLSDNSLEHALLMFATMHLGRPFVSLTSAYSRLAKDYGKVSGILRRLTPGVIYAADGAVYGPAIRAAGLPATVVLGHNAYEVAGARPFAELLRASETPAVMEAFARITPDTHAKYLLTSGSTGQPKIVVNTHRMLCANQQQFRQTWPFLRAEKPVIVSWLPWSHTFGSNNNLNMALANGGSFYIDEGRPVPGLMEKSVRNLREVQPTLYFNVPKGFEALVGFLEEDETFARDFFGRMRGVFYAAAALPQSLWDRLERSAQGVLGEEVWFTAGWGATETSPMLSNVHWPMNGPGCIGLPAPGTEIKFLPANGRLEMRVRGPQVFSEYLHDLDKTAEAFDADGFYQIGDAGALIDPARPEQGIRFDGRLSEDFKLNTGTWVSVGTLRARVVNALAPHVLDVAVTGHDQGEAGLLVFPAPSAQALSPEAFTQHLRMGLRALREEGAGSAQTPRRLLVLDEPPSMEAGEITDKGYLNQRAVLQRRAADVARLHAEPRSEGVLRVD